MIIISGGQAHKIKSLKYELPGLEKVILLDKPEDMDEKDILYEDVSQNWEKNSCRKNRKIR
jgi:hypothetical protein